MCKVDICRLKTIANVARREGISVQAIHKRIKKGLYNVVLIDGVMFIED